MSEITEEEIARAIYEKHCEQYDATPWWVDEPVEIQRGYLAQARAVLTLLHPALERARREERERCALVAAHETIHPLGEQIAAAIRKG